LIFDGDEGRPYKIDTSLAGNPMGTFISKESKGVRPTHLTELWGIDREHSNRLREFAYQERPQFDYGQTVKDRTPRRFLSCDLERQ
jgi:hypothetical protein